MYSPALRGVIIPGHTESRNLAYETSKEKAKKKTFVDFSPQYVTLSSPPPLLLLLLILLSGDHRAELWFSQTQVKS